MLSISNIESLKNLYAKISGNSSDTINPHTISEAIDEITKVYESGGGGSGEIEDSGWIKLDSSRYSTGNTLDTTATKIYHRKIGKMVNVCGSLMWTGSQVPYASFNIPENFRPYAIVPVIGFVPGGESVDCFIDPNGNFNGVTTEYSKYMYFNAMYMTEN